MRRTDGAEAVTEEQIIGISEEAEAGAVVMDLRRNQGMLADDDRQRQTPPS